MNNTPNSHTTPIQEPFFGQYLNTTPIRAEAIEDDHSIDLDHIQCSLPQVYATPSKKFISSPSPSPFSQFPIEAKESEAKYSHYSGISLFIKPLHPINCSIRKY